MSRSHRNVNASPAALIARVFAVGTDQIATQFLHRRRPPRTLPVAVRRCTTPSVSLPLRLRFVRDRTRREGHATTVLPPYRTPRSRYRPVGHPLGLRIGQTHHRWRPLQRVGAVGECRAAGGVAWFLRTCCIQAVDAQRHGRAGRMPRLRSLLERPRPRSRQRVQWVRIRD